METIKEKSTLWLTEEIQDIYIHSIRNNEEFRTFEDNMSKTQKSLISKIEEYIKDINKQKEVLQLVDEFECMANGSACIMDEIIYKEAFIRGISLMSNKR
ncbi:hypothetical protein [Clostridium botulinum]|uniref:hypothetical protein n=1 Tax=Clostridium botulinum TaxID=1491 RepID=UPI001E5AD0DD|nr:hypothetical protein [Clostridium botulinum]MCD3232426.1 hypothetical protein [Clostridium botulinum C/D]